MSTGKSYVFEGFHEVTPYVYGGFGRRCRSNDRAEFLLRAGEPEDQVEPRVQNPQVKSKD